MTKEEVKAIAQSTLQWLATRAQATSKYALTEFQLYFIEKRAQEILKEAK